MKAHTASEVVRRALEKAKSRYAIAKVTGLSQATLSRFAGGEAIMTTTFDKLVDALGLELVPKAPRTRKEGK